MKNIIRTHSALLGDNEEANLKLKLRQRNIDQALNKHEGKGIKAKITTSADTTKKLSKISITVACEDEEVKKMLEESMKKYVGKI